MSNLLRHANSVLGRVASVKLVRHHSLYPWQLRSEDGLLPPEDVDQHWSSDDRRLLELKERYVRCDRQVTTPFVWTDDLVTPDDLTGFRGDNAYVFQRPDLNTNDVAFTLTYYYLKSGSAADLLGLMTEDGAFGVRTLMVDGRLVSRDLLDAAGEIDFLRRHLGLGSRRLALLDIGAGYGRLVHRLSETVASQTSIFATDAFAPSTFLSERYLAHRQSPARVVPLDEVEQFLATQPIDVATNVHSFSECRLEAIEWWVSRLAKARVRYLMVVPNGIILDEARCLTIDGHDMEGVFAEAGYLPIVRELRHRDPLVQRYGLDPTQFNLFELRSG